MPVSASASAVTPPQSSSGPNFVPEPIPDAGPEAAAPVVTLPTAEQLTAPFAKTKAHGFVGVSFAGARELVPIVKGEGVDAAKPVLVASFTKLWTAVAALRLLSLDATIAEVLPSLAKRPWASSTLRELMTHTSLVPEFDEKGGYYRNADVDPADVLAAVTKYVPADWTEKRGVFKYRNAEFAIVGAMLAAHEKKSPGEVLASEVFARAGMKHAGLLGRTKPEGLDLSPMGAIRPQNFFTAGAGYASPEDLFAFFEALGTDALLAAEKRELLFTSSFGSWAYAFEGARMVERPGSFGNVRLFSAYYPDEKRAVIAWTGDGIDLPRPRAAAKGIGAALARLGR
jgi:CubicO group peptidase (beta-lactamase class C family)